MPSPPHGRGGDKGEKRDLQLRSQRRTLSKSLIVSPVVIPRSSLYATLNSLHPPSPCILSPHALSHPVLHPDVSSFRRTSRSRAYVSHKGRNHAIIMMNRETTP